MFPNSVHSRCSRIDKEDTLVCMKGCKELLLFVNCFKSLRLESLCDFFPENILCP